MACLGAPYWAASSSAASGHLVAARGRELGLGDAREHALGGRGWEEDASTDSVREYAASSQKEHSSIETSS